MIDATLSCKVCGADNQVNNLSGATCYNCDNPLQPSGSRRIAGPAVEASAPRRRAGSVADRSFLTNLFVSLCALPYLVLLVGYVLYADVTGDRGWTFMVYLFVVAGLIAFNAVFGIVLLFLRYRYSIEKAKVAVAYGFGVLLPCLYLLHKYSHLK